MPDTAINLGTTTDALAQMTALEQLDWVEKYFDDIGGDYSDPTDLAIAVLWPAAIGKPDNHVLFTRQETPITYGQNRAVDTNNDGRITKGEYVSLALAKYYSYRHLA
ncbi:hypothetical protein HYU10_05300 [Candidatus Woesearchaeota archaeon]|nr:hypothetical protein [Candidatus Woesearchaeota archaeon]